MDSELGRAGNPWVLTDVSLVVKRGDLDPDSVTARLGLQPTAVRMPGLDRWGPPGEVDGQWRLQCDDRTTREFSEQLDNILISAERCAAQLKEMMAEGFEVYLAIYGFANHESRVFFSSLAISRIASLGVPLVLTPNLNER
ncbi:DUF4279 domain-containing protein [Streptomyces sp. NPDC002033]|uniref:DUF4279 domain-containing protein n=1 Tax=unclassified Streptomyces TaxID=2593676 RepID=UPI003331DD45